MASTRLARRVDAAGAAVTRYRLNRLIKRSIPGFNCIWSQSS